MVLNKKCGVYFQKPNTMMQKQNFQLKQERNYNTTITKLHTNLYIYRIYIPFSKKIVSDTKYM